MKTSKLIFLLLAGVLFIASCKKDDDNTDPKKTITLKLSGLEDLGTDFVYEGWLIVNGNPVTTGTFMVDASGKLSQTTFELKATDVDDATTFVLSIEPKNDSDPMPSATKMMAGDFSGNAATVSTGLLGDFSGAAGKYILATPTNGADNDENSGIWFLDIATGSPAVGLMLPQLPDGWKYEGWVVIDGTPVTTGTFTNASATDDADPFSSTMPLPDVNGADGFFPGEDFLVNAPDGLSFPTDIAGGTAVISIEPSPDNSPMPFTLKPLVHNIPASAVDHMVYNMGQNLSFPTGTVSR
ncbi:MAG: anti-sigma factor [Bacteroidales bacterium]|nr:anti-sigma factor [Bacteroidales bacterium]MCF6341806.1 anti-sigma factor [Bacteroidales bacterium]